MQAAPPTSVANLAPWSGFSARWVGSHWHHAEGPAHSAEQIGCPQPPHGDSWPHWTVAGLLLCSWFIGKLGGSCSLCLYIYRLFFPSEEVWPHLTPQFSHWPLVACELRNKLWVNLVPFWGKPVLWTAEQYKSGLLTHNIFQTRKASVLCLLDRSDSDIASIEIPHIDQFLCFTGKLCPLCCSTWDLSPLCCSTPSSTLASCI